MQIARLLKVLIFVHNVGVVILEEPGVVLDDDEYGQLPTVDQFDIFKTKRGQQKVTFTSVGYRLQESFPSAAAWKENNSRTRYAAQPHLIQTNVPGFTGDYSLLLSNNANTGGTCFGDSGVPNFLGIALLLPVLLHLVSMATVLVPAVSSIWIGRMF